MYLVSLHLPPPPPPLFPSDAVAKDTRKGERESKDTEGNEEKKMESGRTERRKGQGEGGKGEGEKEGWMLLIASLGVLVTLYKRGSAQVRSLGSAPVTGWLARGTKGGEGGTRGGEGDTTGGGGRQSYPHLTSEVGLSFKNIVIPIGLLTLRNVVSAFRPFCS